MDSTWSYLSLKNTDQYFEIAWKYFLYFKESFRNPLILFIRLHDIKSKSTQNIDNFDFFKI